MSSTRGPIVIMLMGIGGMIFFAVLANWLAGNNPVIAKHAAYREDVLENFPVAKVGLSRQRKDYTLRLWIDPDEWTGMPIQRDELPAALSSLRHHFERELEVQRAPQKLEVIILSMPGFGCSSEQELCRQSFDLRQERVAFRKELAAELKATVVNLETAEEGVLRLTVAGRPQDRILPKVAGRLATHLGGGWTRIEIKIGRTVWEFDGEGKLLNDGPKRPTIQRSRTSNEGHPRKRVPGPNAAPGSKPAGTPDARRP